MRAAPTVVAVAAIDHRMRVRTAAVLTAGTLLMGPVGVLHAAVLPEERLDLLYHSYDGGGVEVTGPSLMVRKQIGQSLSVSGNYYLDSVSSASIDVVTTASPYKDERTETSLGLDYLHQKSTLSLSLTRSDENDYEATSVGVGVSQDLFGDLTTISFGFGLGSDDVGQRGDPAFSESVDRYQYRLGLTQVLTTRLVATLAWETQSDEGYLNNPYRSVRYIDPGAPVGYSWQAEVYPSTRTSDAASIRAKYFLPYRAAVFAGYRWYDDTWEINADTYELGYIHPFDNGWLVEARYRRYAQRAAEFYSDLFPFADAQNFLARDKELSSFSSDTLGLTVSYEYSGAPGGWLDRASINFAYDRVRFEYSDFRDLTGSTGVVGAEPSYAFDADVVQVYVSAFY